jgi:ABC-type phosphate transport system substrate-binding protein
VTSMGAPSRPRRIVLQLLLGLGALPLIQAVPAQTQTLVVIVNPAIGVQHLSRREVVDIFLGRYRSFPSGASALPIDLDISSDERKAFYLLLAHKDASDMGSYWARLTFSGKISPPFAVPDARTALDIVAHNPNAIAYVDRAAVDQRVRVALEITP